MSPQISLTVWLIATTTLYANPMTPAQQAFEMRLTGQVDEAKTLLEKAVRDDPKDAKAWFELARTCWHQWPVTHDFSGPAKAIDKACNLEPNNARFWQWAGYCHMYNSITKAHKPQAWLGIPGEMTKSAKCFETTLALDPNNCESRYMLYCLYHNNPWFLGGNKKKAAKVLEPLTKINPAYAAVIKADDIDYEKQQDRLTFLTPVLSSNPNEVSVVEAVSKIYQYLGDLDKAEVYARKALTLNTHNHTQVIDLARAWQRQENGLPRAEAWLKSYLQQDGLPNGLRAYALGVLANLYEKQGRIELAKNTRDTAKELDAYSDKTSPEQLDLFTTAP